MSSKPGGFRRFFGALWHTISLMRTIVLNLFFLFLVLVVFSALFSAPMIRIPEGGAALVLRPAGLIVEQESYVDPVSGLLGGPLSGAALRETRLRDLLDAVRIARDDPAISSVVLDLSDLRQGGLTRLRAVGEELLEFKAAGKPVYALGDTYSQDQYYLAAYADEILLHPLGGVDLQGLAAYQTYFGEAIERLQVNVHVFRAGEYKSAVEPFTRDSMSPEAREDARAWLGDLWSIQVADLSLQRQVPPGAIETYINELDQGLAATNGDTAALALQAGLVDRIADRGAMREFLAERVGSDGNGGFRQVDFRDYLRLRGERLRRDGDLGRVGVIVASGIIYDGEQVPGNVGGDTLARLIRMAAEDDGVRAVVLRIDSNGGSVFASEVIRGALEDLQETGKPLVASMGSVAASGGYWIAADADEIWASPATLTGSIGAFALYPTFADSLAELGINTDGVGTTEQAGAYILGNELPPVLVGAIQENLQFVYAKFLDLVAEGRDMTLDQVRAVAEGRVWSGQRALELGLIDRLGGLEEAAASAAQLAGMDDYRLQYFERGLTPSEQLLREIFDLVGLSAASSPAPAATLAGLLRGLEADLRELLSLNDPRGVYLQCLECGVFR